MGRLRMMLRSSRELAIAHRTQFPAHGLGRNDHPMLLEHPSAEVDKSPAHDAVNGRDRPVLDHAGKRGAVIVRQPRSFPRRLAGDQAGRTAGVELDDPVPHDLKPDLNT